MHKIVLDTNILISAIIKKGYPYKILHDLVALNKVQLLMSEEVMDEYNAVIHYTKFSKLVEFKINADEILSHVKRVCLFHKPGIKLSVVKDLSDNKFLELAVSGDADFLITGNKNDFTLTEYENVAIISPRDYYVEYWS